MADATSLLNSARRHSRSTQLAALTAAAIVGLTFWTAPARASIAYAYLLSSGFEFGGGCPACHTNEAGGLGTVTKPFGKTMMKHGLVANDTDSLYQAVALLSASHDDSDGDTIADFDELSPDGDPNDAAVFPEDAAPVPAAPPTTPTTTATTTSSTAEPETTAQPGSTSAPAPSPAPAAGKSDGGCNLVGGAAQPNNSSLAAMLFVLVAFGCGARRRRNARA